LRRRGRLGNSSLACVAATVVLLALAAPAGAATQVGETFVPTITGGSGLTTLQSGSPGGQYTIPSPGVITSWSFQASAASVPELKFKVARPAGGNSFTVVGEDGPQAPSAGVLNTFQTQIRVSAGDVIGFYRSTSGVIYRSSPPSGYSVQNASGDVPAGMPTDFGSPLADSQIDLSARLEADCDSDGLGDESQDADVSSCPPRLSTGQRAAAKKHCRKKFKHDKKKRLKCLKRASKRPL
jgi:hypothetical protein